MRIGRTIPPVAAPLGLADLWYGLRGLFQPIPALETVEDELTFMFGAHHVFLLSSGSAALTVVLKALATMSDRTEVIVPAYTCFTVPAAVVRAGLRPVACDIDHSTFEFDHEQLASLVTDRTLCVIAHHLFSIPTDVDRVRTVCAAHGAFVVEDAAQAMGGEVRGRMLGTLGDVGIFSLGRGKQVTCGEGGVAVTNNMAIAVAIEKHYAVLAPPGLGATLASFSKVIAMWLFIRPSLYWIPAAIPYLRLGETIYPSHIALHRLSGMHAGLMRRVRIRMMRARRARASVAAELRRRLRMSRREDEKYPFLRLPVFAATPADKRRLCEEARRLGLGISQGYPAPISDIPELQTLFDGRKYPHAAYVAAHLLTLPTHHWLTEKDKRAIANHISGIVGSPCPPRVTQPQIGVRA